MNAGNVIKLHTWTGTNKSRIVAENKTLAERAIEATAALGFKVSSNAMADVLKANDIQTRRQSAMQAKISQLEDEREKYGMARRGQARQGFHSTEQGRKYEDDQGSFAGARS